jgi:hypothetical protein
LPPCLLAPLHIRLDGAGSSGPLIDSGGPLLTPCLDRDLDKWRLLANRTIGAAAINVGGEFRQYSGALANEQGCERMMRFIAFADRLHERGCGLSLLLRANFGVSEVMIGLGGSPLSNSGLFGLGHRSPPQDSGGIGLE